MKSSANGFSLAEGSTELLGERFWGCPMESSANGFGEILGERFWGNLHGHPLSLNIFEFDLDQSTTNQLSGITMSS